MSDQFERLKAALADRYAIERELGAGGMATVYLAEDLKHGRKVAVKVLRPELSAVLGADRFLNEITISASLEHPHILTLIDSGEAAGCLYYVMPYVEGESLRDRLNRERQLDVHQALAIARDVASALDYAHRHGVIHRDIKPENILLSEGGAVVADFGIALAVREVGGQRLTETGLSLGTPSYMSPEQAAGDREVTPRTDVYSLGSVVYEVLAGDPPFTGDTVQSVLAKVLTEDPPPIRSVARSIPAEIEDALTTALAKNPAARFATAAEFVEALVGPEPAGAKAISPQRKRNLIAAAIGVAVVLGFLGFRLYRDVSNERWARLAIPEIERLIREKSIVEAYDLARQAERHIPEDPMLQLLLQRATLPVTGPTDPPGARVYYRAYSSPDTNWHYVAETPLEETKVPAWYLRLKLELNGYRPLEVGFNPWGFEFRAKLVPDDAEFGDMVWVPAGAYGFTGKNPVAVDEFLLDRYEVTNADFQTFVDAGGYADARYWTEPFVRDGTRIPWSDAMAEFTDATGRPGPAAWELGQYPDGRADYPVGGVSWYEAVAYCAFVGKSLPTYYHWKQAAGSETRDDILNFSNFGGEGPVPVGSYGGVGPYGTYDMPGNVKEWTWNESRGWRYILGGAWNEPEYLFVDSENVDPFARQPTHGFRCARYDAPLSDDVLGPIDQPYVDFAEFEPVDDETFVIYRSFYAYDPVDVDARLEAADSSEHWRKETVTYTAAYGGERVIAHVLLPTSGTLPFQAIVYFPGVSAVSLRSSANLAEMALMEFIPRSGRALVYPVYKGTYERHVENRTPGKTGARERTVWRALDLLRTVDYLMNRDDIDPEKLGYLGLSWGAEMPAMIGLALEERFGAAVLVGGGFDAGAVSWALPEISPWHFAPRVTLPTLMINGRYDFYFPYETSQLPMFNALGTPERDKRHVVFQSGHIPPWNEVIREVLDWFDKYLGPVTRAPGEIALPRQ